MPYGKNRKAHSFKIYPERECLWCHDLFTPFRKDKQFCCKQCYKSYGKKYLGHKRSKWKRGTLTPSKGYRRFKKEVCEACGFIPEHKCQLDVDHIDGNHKNHDPKNLQTLCANCHRLKTYKQRWTWKRPRKGPNSYCIWLDVYLNSFLIQGRTWFFMTQNRCQAAGGIRRR